MASLNGSQAAARAALPLAVRSLVCALSVFAFDRLGPTWAFAVQWGPSQWQQRALRWIHRSSTAAQLSAWCEARGQVCCVGHLIYPVGGWRAHRQASWKVGKARGRSVSIWRQISRASCSPSTNRMAERVRVKSPKP
eukprot:2751144-Pleurochrysis_carterae.AAC.2